MRLSDMIKSGKIVVVAGAGISKSPPSNLPSWWDFNRILIDTIGEVGSKYGWGKAETRRTIRIGQQSIFQGQIFRQ